MNGEAKKLEDKYLRWGEGGGVEKYSIGTKKHKL